jgi:hypothetical protein
VSDARVRGLGETVLRVKDLAPWRSIYVADPERNIVELVCYDQSVE